MKTITQQTFDEIMKEHYLWLTSDGKAGKQANIKDINLTGLIIDGYNMLGVITN